MGYLFYFMKLATDFLYTVDYIVILSTYLKLWQAFALDVFLT